MTTRERTVTVRVAESRRGNNTHKIDEAKPGVNRFSPGHYRCSCGESFTGVNAFEKHRADANRRR